MAIEQLVFFQPYLRGPRGGIKPGQAVPCRDTAQAELRAEKAMATGRIIGGHVVRCLTDAEAGDYGEPEFLNSYGEVPSQA
jgi:hypothetical protein